MTDKNRKNILLISFDDLFAFHRYRYSYGEPLQTPNLDRICSQSMQFHSAYCQAPLCGPSRASFMSARTPHQLGIFNNSINVFERVGPQDIWSYRLKEAGYYCSSGGKMHHGYGALAPELHSVLYSDGPKRFGNDFALPEHVEKRRYNGINGGWSTVNEEDDGIFYDAKSANSAIDFLDSYDSDKPFYREVGFFSPHGPRFTPARFKDMYNPDNLFMPKEWGNGFDENTFSDEFWDQTPAMIERNWGWWRYNVRNYFSGITHGDYHLGRVWDALRKSKHADNTIVVVTTDHGFMLGTRNRFYKGTIWEQSAGVPLIVFDPSDTRPRINHDPVALLDIGPTILDYAQLDPLRNCMGRSLRPQIEGAQNPDRVIPTFRYDNASIRKGHYRFCKFVDGTTQLYDLRNDIWNYNNLGTDHPEYTSMHSALMATCAEYGMQAELE